MKWILKITTLFLFFLILSPATFSWAHPPKHIIFVIHNETVYGKGFFQIYQALKARGHKVQLIAIPFLTEDNAVKVDIDHEFLKKFDPHEIVYPCGRKAPYKACEAPQMEHADYVIVGNPYNIKTTCALHPHYTLYGFKKLADKVAYFVYGPHLFHAKGNSSSGVLKGLIDVAFVDSESTKKIFEQEMGMSDDQVVVAGYQSYKNVRDQAKKYRKPNSKYKETILWMPRWTLSYLERDIHEAGSTFLTYYHFFTNYAAEHPDVRLIIRPHVYLFLYGVQDKFFSEKDVAHMLQAWKSLPNIVYSKQEERSLVDDVLAADIVISDGTSALAEVVVAGKPIIYLSGGWDNEFNSNDLSREFKDLLYMARCPEQILGYMDLIRENGYKVPQSKAQEAFLKKLDPVENPAEFVAEYITQN